MASFQSSLHVLLENLQSCLRVELLRPLFLHDFFGSRHLVVLLAMLLLWLRWTFKGANFNRNLPRNNGFLYQKIGLFTCLFLGVMDIFFFIYHDYFWFEFDVWTYGHWIALLDLAVRTLAWFAVSAYLRFEFICSGHRKSSLLVRFWCGFFLNVSYSFLVIGFAYFRKAGVLATYDYALDSVSLLCGLIINYIVFFRKRTKQEGEEEEENTHLRESLLDANNASTDMGNVSLFANAGLLSSLAFSWMGPLL